MEVVKEVNEVAPFVALGKSLAAHFPSIPSEIVRAFALGWSPRSVEAWHWLRGDQITEAAAIELDLPEDAPTASSVMQTLATLLKRVGTTLVICCDQSEGFLRRPDATLELTTSLMGWLDSIPNIAIVLSMLKDSWKRIHSAGYLGPFVNRSKALELNTLTGAEAVELLKKRMARWSGLRLDKGPLWPFREDDVIKIATQKPLDPRALLIKCAAALEPWLLKRSEHEIGIDGQNPVAPIEDLFRARWTQILDAVRKEKLNPDNLQEERLFHSINESLELMHRARTAVGDRQILQIQKGALGHKYLGIQIKFAVKGSPDAQTVVVAATKLQGGAAMGGFVNALDEAVSEPVVGAVLVRPTAKLTLGATTVALKKYKDLKSRGKLRPFELAEQRNAFEQLESLLRLLGLAQQNELELGSKIVGIDQCRELVIKCQVLAGLELFDQVFCGWGETATIPVQAAPRYAAVSQHTEHQAAAGAAKMTDQSRAKVPPTELPDVPAHSSGNEPDWADHLLKAVGNKLIEFGQKVEPLGVELGPTFARLRFKPLGRTSIGKVRNHANDLRAHIAGIMTVPVIADQPGYISVDVRRPNRQTVRLNEQLAKGKKALPGRPAFPVGVDVSGQAHWLDLADPSTCHALVAGTTGSGKSEFLKSVLAGLASRMSPLELQFVLIDPKHVTFNFSNDSPYLLHPVAHTIEEAMPLVQECFAETERRYEILEKRGLEHIGQLQGNDALPRRVIVFDEFADLMAERESRRELETSLKRIGALARAAGIHLILATQRPDKDVVTPLLKANLPTRICLRVESERNSKIILDEEGGENLLGNGDLFWKFGGGMMRLQGTFVEKDELEALLRIGS